MTVLNHTAHSVCKEIQEIWADAAETVPFLSIPLALVQNSPAFSKSAAVEEAIREFDDDFMIHYLNDFPRSGMMKEVESLFDQINKTEIIPVSRG